MAINVLPDIAQRYQISMETARRLDESLRVHNGLECDFVCPELGGRGHWTPGQVIGCAGLDPSLRARIDGLCCELAALIRGSDTAAPAALSRPAGTAPAIGHVDLPAGESWWPASYGHPQCTGERLGLRFAFFPNVCRLLVQHGARIMAYDTGEHQLRDLCLVQGHSTDLVFQTERGPVHLDQFRHVPLA